MSSQASDRDGSGNDQARGVTTGVPRWVKVFVVVAVAIAALGVVAMFLAGGEHGPGRHQSAMATSHRGVETPVHWDTA